MPTSRRVEIEVSGNHYPLRLARSARRGVDGYLISQGKGWVWVDDEGFDALVDAADALADEHHEQGPQLGRIEKFPRGTDA